MNPQISIIIPVYKAEAFLHRCIVSILSQSLKDFELILIDDGSPDSSGIICDKYAKQDLRIKVFHKKNGGVSSARNLGLKHANGTWIMFVDSDDFLQEQALERMIKISHSYSSDFFIFRSQVVFHEIAQAPMVNTSLNVQEIEILSPQMYMKNILCYTINVGPYAKLFKANIAKQLAFDEEMKIGEDLLFNLEYANKMIQSEIIYSNLIVYNYFINSASAMHTNNLKREYKTLTNKVFEFFQKNNCKLDKEFDIFRMINIFQPYLANRTYPNAYDTKILCQLDNKLLTKQINRLLYYYVHTAKFSRYLAFVYLRYIYYKWSVKKILHIDI